MQLKIIGDIDKYKIQKIIQKAINKSTAKRDECIIYSPLKYLKYPKPEKGSD